jgi:hypothetical protein
LSEIAAAAPFGQKQTLRLTAAAVDPHTAGKRRLKAAAIALPVARPPGVSLIDRRQFRQEYRSGSAGSGRAAA